VSVGLCAVFLCYVGSNIIKLLQINVVLQYIFRLTLKSICW
jgi:hypothetical protein